MTVNGWIRRAMIGSVAVRWGWIALAGIVTQAMVQVSMTALTLIGREPGALTVSLLLMGVTTGAGAAVALSVDDEAASLNGLLVGVSEAVIAYVVLVFGSVSVVTAATLVLTVAAGSLGGRLATLRSADWDL